MNIETDLIEAFQKLSLEDRGSKKYVRKGYHALFQSLPENDVTTFSLTCHFVHDLTQNFKINGLCKQILKFFSLSCRHRVQYAQEARELVQTLQHIDPKNFFIPLCAGELFRITESYKAVNKAFGQLEKVDLGSYASRIRALVHSRQALFFMTEGRLAEFQRAIHKAYSLNPNDPFILSHYSMSKRDESPIEALQYAQMAYELAEDDPNVSMNYRSLFHGEKTLILLRPQKASYMLLKAVKCTPQPELYLELSKLFEEQKIIPAAKRALRKAIALLSDAETRGAYLNILQECGKKGGVNTSETKFTLPDSPTRSRETVALIESFFSSAYPKKWLLAPKIERLLKELTDQNPLEPLIFLCRGELSLLRQDFTSARGNFALLFGLHLGMKKSNHPLNSYIYSRIGWSWLYNAVETSFLMHKFRSNRRGAISEFLSMAQHFLQKAHVSKDNDPFTLAFLSECAARGPLPISRPELLLKRAYTLFPNDPFVVFHYALAHMNGKGKDLHDRELAREVLVRYDKEYPGNISVNFLLGEMVAIDTPLDALQHYTQAICTPSVLKNPYSLFSLIRRAALLLQHGRTSGDKLQASMDLALVAKHTNNADMLYECAILTKDPMKARALYHRVLQNDKDHLGALFHLAKVNIDNGFYRFLDSCKTFLRIINLDTEEEEIEEEQKKYREEIKALLSKKFVRQQLNKRVRSFLHMPYSQVNGRVKERVEVYAKLLLFWDSSHRLAHKTLRKRRW